MSNSPETEIAPSEEVTIQVSRVSARTENNLDEKQEELVNRIPIDILVQMEEASNVRWYLPLGRKIPRATVETVKKCDAVIVCDKRIHLRMKEKARH